MQLYALILQIYVVPVLVGVGLVVLLTRRSARWRKLDALALLAAPVVWLVLTSSPLVTGRKSLANLIEPLFIAFFLTCAAPLRIAIVHLLPEKWWTAATIAGACAVAAGVFFVVPAMPE